MEELGFDPQKVGKRFEGKVAVITGGSKGIGRAVAYRLAAEGADIAITASSDASATAETIAKVQSLARRCVAFHCDVSEEEEVKEFFEKVLSEFGRIDTVVHSAGISPNVPFFEQTGKLWDDVHHINVTGSFLVTRTAMLAMMALGDKIEDPNVVLLGSTNGINSNDPMSAPYDSSKAGVNLLANTASKEYPKTRVRVNAVAPGWIETSLNATLPPEYRKSETGRIHMGRFANPSEIASSIAYLASTDASFVNGNVHMVDGGYN